MTEGTEGAARLRRLGRAIRSKREAAELTQADLGERIGFVTGESVPQTTVSRWENGAVNLDVEQVRAIEIALQLMPGALLVEAGYVELETVAADAHRAGVRTLHPSTMEEALAAIEAATALGLGVRAFKRPAVGTSSAGDTWTVVLYGDADDL